MLIMVYNGTKENAMEEPQPQNSDVVLHIPLENDNLREELSFYSELYDIFREYGKDTDELDFITGHIQSQIDRFSSERASLPDKNQIEEVILSHPYFRNPCDYPIRLLTILKYLKRRGINVSYTDIDLYVDSILTGMDEIRKIGRGLYMSSKRG